MNLSKKVLFCATVDIHIKNFHIPYLRFFKEQGYEVHVASKGNMNIPYVDKKFDIPFERSPYRLENIKAYRELKKIIDTNKYSIMHFHTPVGGVIGRLAARHAKKKGAKVLYTAHGFHFYKGAPIINWILYYPIEKWLSKYTDCLITINDEDYNIASLNFAKSCIFKKIHGVGVDLKRFRPVDKTEKILLKKKYGFNEDDFILIFPAELNKNKNQGMLIQVVALLKNKISGLRLLLPGEGRFKDKYINMARQLNVKEKVDFLGYRKDIPELLALSDIAVSSSLREGLGINIIEAMATGLPVVATNIRGHRDLITSEKFGYLVEPGDFFTMAKIIYKLFSSKELRQEIGNNCIKRAQEFSLEVSLQEMSEIYKMFF